MITLVTLFALSTFFAQQEIPHRRGGRQAEQEGEDEGGGDGGRLQGTAQRLHQAGRLFQNHTETKGERAPRPCQGCWRPLPQAPCPGMQKGTAAAARPREGEAQLTATLTSVISCLVAEFREVNFFAPTVLTMEDAGRERGLEVFAGRLRPTPPPSCLRFVCAALVITLTLYKAKLNC